MLRRLPVLPAAVRQPLPSIPRFRSRPPQLHSRTASTAEPMAWEAIAVRAGLIHASRLLSLPPMGLAHLITSPLQVPSRLDSVAQLAAHLLIPTHVRRRLWGLQAHSARR